MKKGYEEGLWRRAMKKGSEEGLCPKRLVQQKLFDTFKSFLNLVLYLKSQCRASYGFFAPSYLVFSISLQTWLLSQNW